MRFRKNILLFSVMLLVLSACGKPPLSETSGTETQIQKETETMKETQTIKETETVKEVHETQKRSPEETLISGGEASGVRQYVGLRGHIKEVRQDAALISSDTDDFPGVFWVTGVHELAVEEELKGGTSVFVLMEDTGEKEGDGIRRFRGEQLTALPDEDETARHDILLTSPPPMTLTDLLSSVYHPFEISAGSYSWTMEEDGEGKGVIACGPAPTDETVIKSAARLKLPTYNRMDDVIYSLSCAALPDTLTVRQWDSSAAGDPEAQEESIAILYYYIPIVSLEKGKIYEFTAEWKKTNLEKKGFCGNAGYVLVTE